MKYLNKPKIDSVYDKPMERKRIGERWKTN